MIAEFQRVIEFAQRDDPRHRADRVEEKPPPFMPALRQLDGSSLNIMTIEDPVEYELAGATQIAVNVRANITLRGRASVDLATGPRCDPRGRDARRRGDRRRLAGRADRPPGLPVPLRTKDAIGTISRLQDMGIERYQVASALLMVLAQRLVRVLCPQCRREYPAIGNELEGVGFSFDPGVPLFCRPGLRCVPWHRISRSNRDF